MASPPRNPATSAAALVQLPETRHPRVGRSSLALLGIERRVGRPLVTSRLEELQAMRRGFWLSRWLARANDTP